MSDTMNHEGRTWRVLLRHEDRWLIEWHRPNKPRHVSNYALRWITAPPTGAGFYDTK